MSYYFVFQNTTYLIESAGGYVWAPTHQGGRTIHSHERVGKLEVGDYIVHCAQSNVRAISKVTAAPVISTENYAGHGEWDGKGYYVKTEYFLLNQTIDVRGMMQTIMELQPTKYGPFNISGRGNEGYLFECGRPLFDYLSEHVVHKQTDPLVQQRLRDFCTDENRISMENDLQEIEEINRIGVEVEVPDYTPVPKPVPQIIQTQAGLSYARDRRVAINAMARANHHCEINSDHPSFIRRGTDVMYVEPHHLIPMSAQVEFNHSLDVEANIVALCSNCHNEIHYGKNTKKIIEDLYLKKEYELKQTGIDISLVKLFEIYGLK